MWKVLNSEELVSSRWVSVYREEIELPNGVLIEDFYKVKVLDASAIVAITKEGKIILKSEYRHCYKQELIELPSGVFEKEENDPLDTAKRELLEETGYSSDDWVYLGGTIENSAKLTNTIHLYLAKGCRRVSEQHLDRTENIRVLVLPISEAVEMVLDNRICCNCTAQGILRVARMMGV